MPVLTDHPARLALIDAGRVYPKAWSMADDFRKDRGKDLPDWPGWCYLPLGGWYTIVCAHKGVSRLDAPDLTDMALLAALGAWRYTQGVYSFHPALYYALVDTVPSGEMPVEVLLRLPEWCVYVESPGMFGKLTDGFFAFLEHDANNSRKELRLIAAKDSGYEPLIPIHLGPWTVTEGIDRARQESAKYTTDQTQRFLTDKGVELLAKLAFPMFSLLLYLCSDEPEVEGDTPGTSPQHPRPVKTKMGWRLFPPESPHLWRIGEGIGEKLQRATGAHHEPPPGAESTTRRAHIRRAHWHGYWTGQIKPKPDAPEEKQRRRFSYRWLHPMLVGTGNDDE